jgi:ubiquinone/menaquinone biosynthesis C-methylase UbiE
LAPGADASRCIGIDHPITELLMKAFTGKLLPRLVIAAILIQYAVAATSEITTMTEAESKMFTVSASYERYMGRWSRLLAPVYVSFAGVQNGDRVLDVGTGTGALMSALEAGTTSTALAGIDPSEGFINFAKKNAGSGRATFEVGDAQALRFEDASFDHTMSMLVMNFIPDHEKAIAEMRRVTRPDGIVSSCVWDYNAGMRSLRIFWDEVVALDPAMTSKDERNMKLTREGQLGQLWRKAGLINVQEKALAIEQAFTSFDDYWGPFLTGIGPGGAYVASLTEERRRQLESRLRKRLFGARDDGAFVLKAQVWCVRGEVPKSRG